MKVRGLTLIQASTPEFAKGCLRKSVETILGAGEEESVKELFAAWKEEFKKLPFEEVSIPKSVNTFTKYLHHPKGAGAHVRGAMLYNAMLDKYDIANKYKKVKEGDKIRYAYLKQPNYFSSDVISMLDKYPTEFLDRAEINWDVQWEKVFENAISGIFTTIGWKMKTDSDDCSIEALF